MLRFSFVFFAVMSVLLGGPGCSGVRDTTLSPEPGEGEAGEEGATDRRSQRTRASRRPPAGATCAGRADCASDQTCVAGRCAYRATSVAGEVLASAAEAQASTGNWEGAIETYGEAFDAYREAEAPVPPEIACAAAELVLRTATDVDSRERGASAADHCFRTTVPGDPARVSVTRALARLRFDGLLVGNFDEEAPADDFFDPERAQRPSAEEVEVEIEMADIEARTTSHDAIRAMLNTQDGHRAVVDCFIQDWELNHRRTASADLRLTFDTEMRDLGDIDIYVPRLRISQMTPASDGFEPCLAASVPTLMDGQPRSLRGDWTQVVQFQARAQ